MWEFQYTYEWYESPNDPKAGVNHSALWVLFPIVGFIWMYTEAKRVNEKRLKEKNDSNLWITGRRDISTGYDIKF